ncbi:MAG: peptidoglycan DD-metalloendopeptidase family protein [Candidatus Fournierella pullistercoris]|uniref:Peptidoglycan DD-metalloendopeptidase family protein n=1 Tax=Candidatus Allofournierella pullistercoris TaxID=2838597 RepID=A0A948T1E2_9FIRM|nr:peptidoglycan DD-metalloendopeptidase family protein [Candidatus Fournierella pullistercoris]
MKHKPKGWRRPVSLAVAAVCLALSCGQTTVAATDYKQAWQQAEQKLKEEKALYQEIKNQQAKAEEKKKSLENMQAIIQGQISDAIDQINQKTSEIAIQQQAIADQQGLIDERWQGFCERIQAMQMMHDSGMVAMIASADSLYELLTYSETLQSISQQDTDVLQSMNEEKQRLEEQKEELEQDKADLEQAYSDLEAKKNEYAQSIQQQNETISEQQALATAQAKVVAEQQKAAEEAEKQYEQWVQSQSSQGSGQSAEGFCWPLPVAGQVTTEFGATQNVNGVIMTGHKGMDIAAAGGTPIYAAHDGRISSTTGHWTYGNVVMVDNGDGVTTLYAHMSSIAATVGQQVKKGDVIGYVGSTGRSTGNHLHFEVRINGVRQNPRNYISF